MNRSELVKRLAMLPLAASVLAERLDNDESAGFVSTKEVMADASRVADIHIDMIGDYQRARYPAETVAEIRDVLQTVWRAAYETAVRDAGGPVVRP